MQTMQQRRAQYALQRVKKVADENKENKAFFKEYKSYAAALPAMIHMNGLGQAAAFYRSKGDTHRELYDLLSGWLCQEGQSFAGKTDLLDGITGSNMHTYRLAQAEAQALMDWVKKFAKAYMTEETKEDGKDAPAL
jgi:CRISPR-associated protein Cmr5